MAEPAPRYCYRHPDRETGLSCSECGRPICYECMTPAPGGLRCPEHSGRSQGVRKVTRPMQEAVTGVGSNRINAVTMTLIAINVAVFLAELGAGGTIQGTRNWIYTHGALFASGAYFGGSVIPVPGFVPIAKHGVAHGEWWRLITAAFLPIFGRTLVYAVATMLRSRCGVAGRSAVWMGRSSTGRWS